MVPLELYVPVQLISNLLETLSKFFVVWVDQLLSAQLLSGHFRVILPISPDSLVDEATRTRKA